MTKSQDTPFFKHVQRRFVLAYQRTRNCDELRNWRPAILKNPHADTPSNHLPGSRTSIPKIPQVGKETFSLSWEQPSVLA